MKNQNKFIHIAMHTIFVLTLPPLLGSTSALAASKNTEQCYGIVKTGMNDCQTSTQSCAGSATKDSQKDAFIFVPTGTCNKIVGGSLVSIVEKKKVTNNSR